MLLSGGLDSTTALAIASLETSAVHALTFSYGQRHAAEIAAARQIGERYGVASHRFAVIDLGIFGGSALTTDIPVPKDRALGGNTGIPLTYVPARNTIFLSYALALAEVTASDRIYIGVNSLDYSGYPDCRPEFIAAFETVANLATRAGVEGVTRVRICTPLLHMTKAGIIRKGRELGVDYSGTTSCYDPAPAGEACGRCDACRLRLRGFAEAGESDPIRYATR